MTKTNPDLIEQQAMKEALGLKGVLGDWAAKTVCALVGTRKVNRLYKMREDRPDGPDFSIGLLEDIGIEYDIPAEQLDNIPAEGGFITVSNHPFGAIDGLLLSALIGKRRPDFKILTTFFLTMIPNLRKDFIPVDNFSSGKDRSIKGIRSAFEHIRSGGALGLFPAGEVATWQKKNNKTAKGAWVIEDKPWPENMMRLILKSGLPVIPVYFDGTNSRLFHLLGLIHPLLRTLRLPREMCNAGGKKVKVRIGKMVPAANLASMSPEKLGNFLRNLVYSYEYQCLPSKENAAAEAKAEQIAPPVEKELIRKDIAAIEDKCLFRTQDYAGYLIKAADAPHLMKELYRQREITFRSVGEGTLKSEDTDAFDLYYSHLILWSIPDEEIVGAYRMGYGGEILKDRGGLAGLYTSTLIQYGPKAREVLSTTMELGRSFIVPKYQRDVLPLKLMFSGLCVATTCGSPVDNCTGLVSISEALPGYLQSILVHFLRRDFSLEEGEAFARSTTPFRPTYLRVDPDALLSCVEKGDIDSLDRLIYTISAGKYRIPVLVRKYFSCGAHAACFNVDPDFSNSLDGMIELKLRDFPPRSIRSFVRFLPKEQQDKVFLNFYGTTEA